MQLIYHLAAVEPSSTRTYGRVRGRARAQEVLARRCFEIRAGGFIID